MRQNAAPGGLSGSIEWLPFGDMAVLSETDLSATACGVHAFPRGCRQSFWRIGLFLLLSAGVHLFALWLAFGVVVQPPTSSFLPALRVDVREPARPPVKLAEASASRRESPRAVDRPRPVALAAIPMKKASPVAPPLLTTATTVAATSPLAVPSQAAPGLAEAAPVTPTPGPGIAVRFDAAYLHNPKPVYPVASRRLGEEGRVLLRVRVSAQGLPAEVDVKQSSGFPRLDEAARAAVERWRFVPARRGTEAVEASVLVPLQFSLDS
ncbi:MAG: energy transducer TonB [Candidatus Accumulibacter phosphatis]|nr:energy transducer TonB [Candidatus Accumulibacter phosphatis]